VLPARGTSADSKDEFEINFQPQIRVLKLVPRPTGTGGCYPHGAMNRTGAVGTPRPTTLIPSWARLFYFVGARMYSRMSAIVFGVSPTSSPSGIIDHGWGRMS
jgi:hypothetical protein